MSAPGRNHCFHCDQEIEEPIGWHKDICPTCRRVLGTRPDDPPPPRQILDPVPSQTPLRPTPYSPDVWWSHYACCDKAVKWPCVCSAHIDCVEHGDKHHGTHD